MEVSPAQVTIGRAERGQDEGGGAGETYRPRPSVEAATGRARCYSAQPPRPRLLLTQARPCCGGEVLSRPCSIDQVPMFFQAEAITFFFAAAAHTASADAYNNYVHTRKKESEKARRQTSLIFFRFLKDFGFLGASVWSYLASWSRLGAVLGPLGASSEPS